MTVINFVDIIHIWINQLAICQ